MVNKQIKRLPIVLLVVILVVMMLGTVVTAAKDLVVDQSDVFSSSQEEQLTQSLADLGTEFNMDIVIVTTDYAEGKTPMAYADDYFDYNDYGVGDNRDGILLLMDFDNRDVWISTRGSGIRYLTDDRINSILDNIMASGMTTENYYGAAQAFITSTSMFLIEGIPSDQHNETEGTNTVVTTTGGHYTEMVIDLADVFTAEQETLLKSEATRLGGQYSLDLIIVTTNFAGYDGAQIYAETFYAENGYSSDGILLLMDFDNHQTWITTSGTGKRYLDDIRWASVTSDVLNGGMIAGDYFGAANIFLSSTDKYLIEGMVNDTPTEETPANTLSPVEGVISLLGSGGVGAGIFGSVRKRYKGKNTNQIFDYQRNSLVNFGITADNLFNTYTTSRRIPRPTSSSGGGTFGGGGGSFGGGSSSTHTSSSGGSHGGGGRGF